MRRARRRGRRRRRRFGGSRRALARTLTAIESGTLAAALQRELDDAAERRSVPVVGITGTGGSGKSSLTDELVLRLRLDQEDKVRVAVLAVDPTRRRAGGALLGDRIRMNSIDTPQAFFRSIATRSAPTELPPYLPQMIAACKAAGFDLVVVETPGIGQGDSAVIDVASVSLYVMTPEYGAASQLEKIDMLDFADAVAINKFERRGARGRAARGPPPGRPQPKGVRRAGRGPPGVRHRGVALQR